MNDEGSRKAWNPRSTAQRLRDILEWSESARSQAKALTREQFHAQSTARKAIVYDLLCVSEATSRLLELDPVLASRRPEIPWNAIRAIANILRHAYGNVDHDVVWDTVEKGDLEQLMQVARLELDRLEGGVN